ncbi:alpha/beta fold hydrolase [Streptomyces sp. NPDC000405]|uniref:alpha/beta fold hydrolase n=1 Tax=Streptomyces sp. NPDC000405 TaxID=3161033 RepID=UPI00398CF45A
MAVFVLVAGGWLGGWAWRDVAAELERAGHRAVPVTLTGLGDRAHLATAGTGLSTHVQDVLNVLAYEELSDVVLVGHSYGIFPVLGAADRCPERVGRVVFLDAAAPQDGESVVNTFMDPERRAAFEKRVATEGEGSRFPLPGPDELPAWGSLDGLDDAALARMRRLAVGHPYGSFTEPLRLTGAGDRLPASAVFCTANGNTLAMIEALHRAGDPRLRAVVDKDTTFFELLTGHYPMLSMPTATAHVLIDAAEGRGRRLEPGP